MAWRSGVACMSQHHNPWMAVKRETEPHQRLLLFLLAVYVALIS